MANSSKSSTGNLKNLMAKIRYAMRWKIGTTLKVSAKIGSSRAKQLCVELAEADITPMAWKAICRRRGCYQSKKKAGRASYDWNTDFSELFLRLVALPWNSLFIRELSHMLHGYSHTLTRDLRVFSASMEASVVSICGRNYQPVDEVFKEVPGVESKIRDRVLLAFESTQMKAQDISRKIKGLIVQQMSPVYEKCIRETGELT